MLFALLLALASPDELQLPQVISTWLEDVMKDPSSVQVKETVPPRLTEWKIPNGMFRKPTVVEANLYCYRINAKNSYGAYGGFKGYLIVVENGTGKVIDYSVDDWRMGREAVESNCKEDQP